MGIKIFHTICIFLLLLTGCSDEKNPIGLDSKVVSWVNMQSGITNNLYAVWGTSSNNVYAVGQGKLFHYDGIEWSQVNLDPSYYINSIWGNRANNFYATGKNGLFLHYNGSSWEKIETNTTLSLGKIFGLENGTIIIHQEFGTILKYHNKILTTDLINHRFTTYGIWGIEDFAHPLVEKKTNNFVLVGIKSVLVVVGSKFTLLRSNPTKYTDIHGSSWNNIYAVGYPQRVSYFDGYDVTIKSLPVPTYRLETVWTVGQKKAIFAGYNGKIYFFDGENWTLQKSGTDQYLRDIWGAEDGTLFVVGANGTILKSVKQ